MEMKLRDIANNYGSGVFQTASQVIERICKTAGSDELNNVAALGKRVEEAKAISK